MENSLGDAYAEEIQDGLAHAISRERQRRTYGDNEGDDEITPLIAATSRPKHPNRGVSYQKAIDEPWTGAHGKGDLPWYKRPSVYWLLPAFFPFCLAFGGIIVPKTYLMQDLICRDLMRERSMADPSFTFAPIQIGGHNDQCGEDDVVQARTAIFNLYVQLLSGVFSALVAPYFGALSDRVGRKPIIISATFGAFVSELITIAVGTMPDSLSYRWLLLGALADGICGSFTTCMALCFAYASDCTAPETRAVAFGHFHANLFAGVAIGPILSGALIKATGNIMIPFYFALGCHLFFILFTALIVPESLSKERQMIAREKRAADTAERGGNRTTLKDYNIFAPLWILWPRGPGSSRQLRRNLSVLAAIDTMMFGVAMGTMQIMIIYARKKFHWQPFEASEFLSIANVCRVSGLLFVLPGLTRWFRGPRKQQSDGHRGSDMLDIWIVRGTILLDLLGYLGYAFVPTGSLFILSGIIASFGGMGPPTLQSSMTKHIPADRTGQILGATGLLHALARVVAPVVFNLIYSKTVSMWAGLVFICLSSIFVIVFALSWFLKPGIYLNESIKFNPNTQEEVQSAS